MLMHVQATIQLRNLPITKTKLENLKQNLAETNAAKCYKTETKKTLKTFSKE